MNMIVRLLLFSTHYYIQHRATGYTQILLEDSEITY